jgi:uroporphyrinogen decarboxylase
MENAAASSPFEKRLELIKTIASWIETNPPKPEQQWLRTWLFQKDRGNHAEPLIEIIARIGRETSLRPLGLSILEILRGMRLCDLIQIAERRMMFMLTGTVTARLNGTSVKQNIMDPETAYNSLAHCTEEFPTAFAVTTFPDPSLVPESCGCEVKFPEDGTPLVTRHSIQTSNDIEHLEKEGLPMSPRMMNGMETMSAMRERFALLNWALDGAPFSLAALLGGVESVAKKIIKDPEFVLRLLDFCTNISIAAAQMMIQAGSDIILLGDPTSGLLSRKHYERFAAPYIKRVVEAVNVPVILHVCGKTTHIIEQMCATGVQAISIDSLVDLPSIVPRVPEDIVIIGNLDPVDPVMTGSPEDAASATGDLLDKMRDVPNYMFSTGCELPLETPPENIQAMIETVKSYR